MPDNGFNSFSKTGHNQNSSNSKPKVFTTMGNTVEEKEKNQQSWVNIYRADIVMIDIETEASTILSSGLRPVGIALANDGEHIVFTSCLGEEKKNTQQNVFDLWISPLKTKERHGEQQCIAERIRMNYGMSFSWSHNDQSIYYSTTGPLSDGSLWLVDLASSNQKRLYEQKDISFGRDYEGPFPMSNGAILMVANGDLWCYFSLTGHIEKFTLPRERKVTAILPEGNQSGTNVIVQTSDPAEALDGFWRVNYTTGETEKIVEEFGRHLPWYGGGAVCGKSDNVDMIIYWTQAADQPPAIRVFDIASKTGSCIVEFTKLQTKVELGSTQLITWTKGGNKRRGALLLPKNREGQVPAIMRVYGGSMQSQNVRFFGLSPSAADNHQLFASHGYAVFLPDLPMAQDHEPASEITDGIESAFNALAEHPDIDSDRIGIIGHSFGGYSTLIAITRLQRFKAAVVSAGIGNLISLYTDFDYDNFYHNYGLIEDGQVNMGATLWENRDRYIRNSPLFDFHKIKTPVLVVQGTRDNLCRNEAGPIFSSLKRLDKTAELVLYDEGHWQGTWQKENLQDYYDRVLSWFDKYL
ncbi:S9 family peptidase [Lentibacillus sp. CBA3610]|nr:S9 family peptidase [Lentibacillus sp. CBA3610]